ncbi:AAA family ATPase [Sulfidibacter corallicola]|uniref:AAA family ATPase n=1 Tax=Sulfidibacter corallicola TaxID=2818388 RepID=A0A8A4TS51_SULCO|nr:AAA family ATPase [Sulfidibacter corallicola]QTD52343.1 AAA family ATPase [Sulfidibacter corallicola]
MKILAIRGANLTSIAGSFAVELNAEPLNETGLFAITGPTGAGKSTLLDALCVSLFNKIPRLENLGRGVEIGHEGGDRLNHADPRNLIRRGAPKGHAETEFVGVDERIYRARWWVERVSRGATKGILKKVEMSLVDVAAEQTLGRTLTETLHLIEGKIGLAFAQFRRSVLLAQGDFAAFLKADTGERSDLLERMTGTDIYSRLSVRCHERARAEEDAENLLREKLDFHEVMDDATRTDALLARDQAKSGLERSQEREKELDRAERWLAQTEKLEEEEARARTEAALAEEALAATADIQEEWAQYRRIQTLRPLRDRHDRARELLDRTEIACAEAIAARDRQRTAHQAAETEKAAAQVTWSEARNRLIKIKPELARAAELDAAIDRTAGDLTEARHSLEKVETEATRKRAELAELDAAKDRLLECLAQAESWFAQNEEIGLLAGQWTRWHDELDRYHKAHVAAADASHALAEMKRRAETFAERERELNQAHAAATADLDALRRRLGEAERALEDIDATDLPEQRKALLQARDRLAEARRQRTELLRCKQARERAGKAYDELVARGKKARVELESCRAACERLAVRHNEARDTLDRLKLAAGSDVRDLRATLVEGQPCPVCGAAEHPYASEAPAHRILGEQVARVRELEATLNRETEKRSHAEAEIKLMRTEAQRSKQDLESLQEEESQAMTRWGAAHQAVAIESLPEDPGSPDCESLLVARGTRIDDQLDALDRREHRLKAARKDLSDLQALCDKQRAKRDQIAEASQKAVQNRLEEKSISSAKEREVLHAEQLKRDLSAVLAKPLAWVSDLEARLGADPLEVRETAESRAVAWHRVEREAADHRVKLQEIDPHRQRLVTDLTSLRDREQLWRQKVTEAQTALEAQRAQRAELLDGKPTVEVAEALEGAEQRAADHLERIKRGEEHAARELAVLERRAHDLEAQRGEQAEALDEAAAAWNEALSDAPHPEPRIREWLDQDPASWEAKRTRIETRQQAHQAAQVRLQERAHQLEKHAAQRPPHLDQASEEPSNPLSLKEVRETLEQTRQDRADREQAFYQFKHRLERDDEIRAGKRDLQEAYTRQCERTGLWKAMKDLIGSSTGKKFRQYAQSLTLDALLGYANRHLEDLARRYQLQRVPHIESLELQILDRDMGDEIRSVNSLSGGESFLVSLALALGLASLSAETTQVESLFIDEGFGALDPESLDLAINALDSLQATGRQVGVISHIPTLIERIGTRVVVRPLGSGRSRIQVTSAFEAG